MRNLICVIALGMLLGTAQAAPFEFVRIGDVDGFGYGDGAGFSAANGGPANNDGVGVLAALDFLPDITGNGGVVTGNLDDFDFRSAAELLGTAHVIGGGATGVTTAGSDHTDISLSTSYDTSSANGIVLIGTGPNVFGTGGAFPGDGIPNTLTNQPGFSFDFFVATGDIDPLAPVFFNMVFGDYDVSPASVTFTRANGTTFSVAVTVQPPGSDGLIQATFAALAFGDVFTAGAGGWDGFLLVDFDADREPYTAFDYVELSVDAISTQPPTAIPEPTSLLLVLVGAAGIARRRRRRSA